MPVFGLISRRNLIAALRSAGFSGPYSGGKHQFMVRDNLPKNFSLKPPLLRG